MPRALTALFATLFALAMLILLETPTTEAQRDRVVQRTSTVRFLSKSNGEMFSIPERGTIPHAEAQMAASFRWFSDCGVQAMVGELEDTAALIIDRPTAANSPLSFMTLFAAETGLHLTETVTKCTELLASVVPSVDAASWVDGQLCIELHNANGTDVCERAGLPRHFPAPAMAAHALSNAGRFLTTP